MCGVLACAGEYWVLWGIWLGTSLIGLLVGCYAVSVLMFPICVEAQNMMPHLPLRMFVILVLHGSSTAYGTPLGYVTSIMVQQAANMTWGHFAKFGFILQFALGFVIPALILATIPRTERDDPDY
jgi:di/tricarboxylate transporter